MPPTRALATWSLLLSVPLEQSQSWEVFTTGETIPTFTMGERNVIWSSSTSRTFPISALALAVARWPVLSLGPGLRLAGPGPLVAEKAPLLARYLQVGHRPGGPHLMMICRLPSQLPPSCSPSPTQPPAST